MKVLSHANVSDLICFEGREPSKLKKIFILILSLLYGLLTSQLPDIYFKDFGNYLVYAASSSEIAQRYFDRGIISFLSNEPVWLFLNQLLSYGLSPTQTVRTIIFLSAALFSWLLIRNNFRYLIWVIAFLFLPQILKNYLIHIRQGTGIAFFLLGWFSVNRNARLAGFALAALTHSSFFFINGLLFLNWCFVQIKISNGLKKLSFAVSGILLGLLTGNVARLLGSRQGIEHSFVSPEVSGLGFLLWFLVLITVITERKQNQRSLSFTYALIIFYLVNYWTLEVNARIFESGMAVILTTGLWLSGWRRQCFLGIMLCSGLVIWLSKFSQTSFGFAVSH